MAPGRGASRDLLTSRVPQSGRQEGIVGVAERGDNLTQKPWRRCMSTIVTPKIVLGPQLAGISLAPEEFDAIEEANRDYRYELIDGRLIVTPPPLEAERGPNEDLGHRLLTYRDSHPQGSALDDTLPEQTVVTRGNRRRADRVIWTGLGRQP